MFSKKFKCINDIFLLNFASEQAVHISLSKQALKNPTPKPKQKKSPTTAEVEYLGNSHFLMPNDFIYKRLTI